MDFSKLEGDEMRLWTWLQGRALGRAHAVTIPDVAASLAWSVRRVQDLAAAMRVKGFPVITARHGEPRGMFIATRWNELDEYRRTLHHIAVRLHQEEGALKRMHPAAARSAAQGRLFAN